MSERAQASSSGIRALSGDALVAFDSDLRVLLWNEAAEQLTGLRSAEVLGRPCWEAVSGIDESGERVCWEGCAIARCAREGRPVPCAHLLIRTVAGRRRVLLSTLSCEHAGQRAFFHLMQPILSVYERERLPLPPPPSPPERTGPALTRRQQEVLRLLAEGSTTAAIASGLSLSEATVRNHIRAVLRALGCHSRLEAVAKARGLKLL